MTDEKTLRVGAVNLNRVFGTIKKFAELQRDVDRYRNGLTEDLERVKQSIKQASPTERKNLQNEFDALRMTLASDVSQFATRQRNEVVEQIKQVIQEKAKEKTLDLVIDSGEVNAIGLPVVLFMREGLDMTDEIITVMNNKYPAT